MQEHGFLKIIRLFTAEIEIPLSLGEKGSFLTVLSLLINYLDAGLKCMLSKFLDDTKLGEALSPSRVETP